VYNAVGNIFYIYLIETLRSSWSVILFEETNEIQHVPSSWLISEKKCWFPASKFDNKDGTFFNSNQIKRMILECASHNKYDGLVYKATKVAGPFGEYIFINFCHLIIV